MGLSQIRFLFLGGPWDKEWHTIGSGHYAYNVPIIRRFVVKAYSKDDAHDVFPEIPRYSTYHPIKIYFKGWKIHLTVYTSYPYPFQIPNGTVLPGLVQGSRPERIDLDSDAAEYAKDEHEYWLQRYQEREHALDWYPRLSGE